MSVTTNGHNKALVVGEAALTGWRGSSATRSRSPVAKRTRFSVEQVEAAIGFAMLAYAMLPARPAPGPGRAGRRNDFVQEGSQNGIIGDAAVVTREPATSGIEPPPEARRARHGTGARSCAPSSANPLPSTWRVYDAVASSRTPTLDRTMSASLAGRRPFRAVVRDRRGPGRDRGRRGRLAARDGVLAIGLASATVNLGVKPLAPRRRPLRDERSRSPRTDGCGCPRPRRSHRGTRPRRSRSRRRSGSGSRRCGSRCALWRCSSATPASHTGVHYPGDVVAGAVVGSTCGWTVARRTARDR
jgi:undecaprenyl-diphosphatase